MNTYQKIHEILKNYSESDYKKFSASLLPKGTNLLGIRLPTLRKLAKKITKEDWQSYLSVDTDIFEEKLIQSFIIGLITQNDKDFELIEKFVPKINNWSICDSFCCSLKFTKNNKQSVWDFIQKYLNSEKEYETRFGLVMILNYYIETEYLQRIFHILNEFKNKNYYAQMAAAWLLSMCYVRFPQTTNEYLQTSKLDKFTYNKSLQKIIESNKIDKRTKDYIKTLKRT